MKSLYLQLAAEELLCDYWKGNMNIPDLKGNATDSQYNNFSFHAKGGMGEVYKATDCTNQETVAVKLIPLIDLNDRSLLERELDVSKTLSGSNIVDTRYTGSVNIHGIEYLYIVQKFYANGNMRAILQPNTDIDDCLYMMKSILDGLALVHEKVVHRDIKPENILLGDSRELLVSDFGLSKYIDDKTKSRTYKGYGTIPYMAPECWLFRDNTISMDIYSLGIMFFEILVGKLPFDGKNENDWRDFHLYQNPPDPATIRKDVPVRLSEIISRMTQKDIGSRYARVQNILVDLAKVNQSLKQKEADADRLAKIAHSYVQKKTGEALRAEREQEVVTDYCRMLNYHITEYFGKLKTIVNGVNDNLDTGNQISLIERDDVSNPRSRSMSITFSGKTISVTFPEWDIISKWEEKEKQRLIEYQRSKYGMVLLGIEDSEFKKKSIIYLGKVECNFVNSSYQERFGYNIVLVKRDTDDYGKWYVASFSDSCLSRGGRRNFALDFGKFLDNFSKAFILSSIDVDYHEISESDCARTIEEILH